VVFAEGAHDHAVGNSVFIVVRGVVSLVVRTDDEAIDPGTRAAAARRCNWLLQCNL
jgi:hypothetical protein